MDWLRRLETRIRKNKEGKKMSETFKEFIEKNSFTEEYLTRCKIKKQDKIAKSLRKDFIALRVRERNKAIRVKDLGEWALEKHLDMIEKYGKRFKPENTVYGEIAVACLGENEVANRICAMHKSAKNKALGRTRK